jgi:hypothetical protein
MSSVVSKLLERTASISSPSLFPEPELAKQEIQVISKTIAGFEVPVVVGEFWTSKQRQACSLHEVSYRACFKPQLPAYFVHRFSSMGDIVYDPFGGRGTTSIEAALTGRVPISNDINPLSEILAKPRLRPPEMRSIAARLESLKFEEGTKAGLDLSMFYHPKTEAEIACLRNYLAQKKEDGTEDEIDSWIRMVATNRLTGHSPGFFSVYSLPPNQAVSQTRQIKINEKLRQTPEYRDTRAIILKKSKQLLAKVSPQELLNLQDYGSCALFLCCDARETVNIQSNSVQLIITSPPFLDIVQYADDNWLRCWFNNIDLPSVASKITAHKKLEDWVSVMQNVFDELYRIAKPGAYVAFEVGEVKKGKIRLEEHVLPLGLGSGFNCESVIINSQSFTKTANIWGVGNNKVGTNTNRIVLFSKKNST